MSSRSSRPRGSGSSGSDTVTLPRRRTLRTLRPWWIASAAIVLVAVALTVFLLTRKPAPPVYVAVLKPEIAGSYSPEDQARVTANIQAALLRTVAALDGLAALDFNKVNAVKGTPAAVAQAMAAGEVIASRADCAGDLCHVSLQRLGGEDGRVLWSEALEVPSSRPRLFADAIASALRQGYGDRRLRVSRLELEIQEKDYQTFLDLKRRLTEEGASDEVLALLEALRTRAPSFVEAYAQEARVARRRYLETGDTRYLDAWPCRGPGSDPDCAGGSPASRCPFRAGAVGGTSRRGRSHSCEPGGDRSGRKPPSARPARRDAGPAEEGLELMQAAVDLQPSWPNLLTLANAEYRQSRFDDARRHLEDLLARSPGNLEGLKTLAQIELLRNPERAVALLREVVKSDPGTGSLTNLGVNLLLLRRYDEAEASLRQALARKPDDPSAALNLADCLTLLGRSAEARATLRRHCPVRVSSCHSRRLENACRPGPGVRPSRRNREEYRRDPAGPAVDAQTMAISPFKPRSSTCSSATAAPPSSMPGRPRSRKSMPSGSLSPFSTLCAMSRPSRP